MATARNKGGIVKAAAKNVAKLYRSGAASPAMPVVSGHQKDMVEIAGLTKMRSSKVGGPDAAGNRYGAGRDSAMKSFKMTKKK